MQLTAELSLYPFREGYVEVIKAFIEAANRHPDLTIISNAMSTQVCGDHDKVINLISRELQASYEKFGKQVLVCKLIPGELDIQ